MVLWGDTEKKPLSTKLQTQLKISNHCQIMPNAEWKKHTDWMPMTTISCAIAKTKEELRDKEARKKKGEQSREESRLELTEAEKFRGRTVSLGSR